MSMLKHAKKIAAADRRQAHRATLRHNGTVVGSMARLTELADQPPLIALAVGTFAAGAIAREPRVARTGMRMLAAHLAATAAKTMVKSLVNRTRPSRAVHDGHRLERGDGADDSSMNSFPSGHTAGAVAVAEAVAAESTALGLPARVAAAAVGTLQPERGKHYLSDVAAGAVIGWVAERTTRQLVGAIWREIYRLHPGWWRSDQAPENARTPMAQGCPVPPAAP